MKHRSISERLARAASIDVKREIARDWAANWRADHDTTILAAGRALAAGDLDETGRRLGQLKALHDKAFVGLQAVLEDLGR